MATWAPTHGASADVRTLSGRIINAQLDEIHRMQQWLADRRQPIVAPQLTRDTSMRDMPGMHMAGDSLMPGMLSSAQLDTLDHARGEVFDRLFLTYMIQHHTGAVHMVQQLFSTFGNMKNCGQEMHPPQTSVSTIKEDSTELEIGRSTTTFRIAQTWQCLIAGLNVSVDANQG